MVSLTIGRAMENLTPCETLSAVQMGVIGFLLLVLWFKHRDGR